LILARFPPWTIDVFFVSPSFLALIFSLSYESTVFSFFSDEYWFLLLPEELSPTFPAYQFLATRVHLTGSDALFFFQVVINSIFARRGFLDDFFLPFDTSSVWQTSFLLIRARTPPPATALIKTVRGLDVDNSSLLSHTERLRRILSSEQVGGAKVPPQEELSHVSPPPPLRARNLPFPLGDTSPHISAPAE